MKKELLLQHIKFFEDLKKKELWQREYVKLGELSKLTRTSKAMLIKWEFNGLLFSERTGKEKHRCYFLEKNMIRIKKIKEMMSNGITLDLVISKLSIKKK